MSLLVIGTVALDSIKTPAGIQPDLLGGSAAHFAMGARLFQKVHLVAIVGQDFPQQHIHFLKQKEIDLTSLKVGDGKSFRWEGEYKKEDLNSALTLATELGVLIGFIPEVALHQKRIPNVFLANIDPDIQMGLLKMMHKPKLVGLDSMNLWINHKSKELKKLMTQVNLFVANDGEARSLTGEYNLVKAAKALRRMGPELIVVKKGEHGVLFFCDSFTFSFPAYPVEEVVDPTGAGDTFAGGLMGYLSRAGKINKTVLKKAVLYGTTLASFNVEGFGMSKTSPLTLTKANQRLKKLLAHISFS